MNTRLVTLVVLTLVLAGCAPSHPTRHAATETDWMSSRERISASAGLLAEQEHRPMALLLDELARHRDALHLVAGGETSLSQSIDALVIDLGSTFESDLYTRYGALTPAQQQTYDEVTLLVDELRILIGRALTGASPQGSEPPPAVRLS